MSPGTGDLSLAGEVALAWARGPTRSLLVPLLTLDERLGRIVAGAREPMLAQMRLA